MMKYDMVVEIIFRHFYDDHSEVIGIPESSIER